MEPVNMNLIVSVQNDAAGLGDHGVIKQLIMRAFERASIDEDNLKKCLSLDLPDRTEQNYAALCDMSKKRALIKGFATAVSEHKLAIPDNHALLGKKVYYREKGNNVIIMIDYPPAEEGFILAEPSAE